MRPSLFNFSPWKSKQNCWFTFLSLQCWILSIGKFRLEEVFDYNDRLLQTNEDIDVNIFSLKKFSEINQMYVGSWCSPTGAKTIPVITIFCAFANKHLTSWKPAAVTFKLGLFLASRYNFFFNQEMHLKELQVRQCVSRSSNRTTGWSRYSTGSFRYKYKAFSSKKTLLTGCTRKRKILRR